jgi:predicted ATPase
MPAADLPRIERLRVKNFRVLRDVQMDKLTPFTVLLGPNGSGKSTVFDVFAFLSEALTSGLRPAWERRNRFRELRSRGAKGPVSIEISYREARDLPLVTYTLAIDERAGGPVVAREELRWRRGSGGGRPYSFLTFENGQGQIAGGDNPGEDSERESDRLDSPDLLAVSTYGQLASHPRVAALRRFITGWYLSYVSAASTRLVAEAGPQERLSETGDNLPNLLQYLQEQHGARLEKIVSVLRERVPRLERVDSSVMEDGRLLLQIKDAPFDHPVLAKYASDGTLKMLAYLAVLYDPDPPPFIGIEEPENQLHPRLLHGLAEECRSAAGRSQVLVTTHSPEFVSATRGKELWVLGRDESGFTTATRAIEIDFVAEHVESGASFGDLWMEGYFGAEGLR